MIELLSRFWRVSSSLWYHELHKEWEAAEALRWTGSDEEPAAAWWEELTPKENKNFFCQIFSSVTGNPFRGMKSRNGLRTSCCLHAWTLHLGFHYHAGTLWLCVWRVWGLKRWQDWRWWRWTSWWQQRETFWRSDVYFSSFCVKLHLSVFLLWGIRATMIEEK